MSRLSQELKIGAWMKHQFDLNRSLGVVDFARWAGSYNSI